jgi:hypothetical protein
MTLRAASYAQVPITKSRPKKNKMMKRTSMAVRRKDHSKFAVEGGVTQ